MANDLTNYAENLIGQHLFRTGTWSKPGTLWVALLTAASDPEAGSVTEVSGGSYARASVACVDGSWTPPVSGNKQYSNAQAITFPTPTGSWGVITHFALMDASTGGNALVVAPLTSSRQVQSGDVAPSFAVDTLRITFSGAWSNYLAGRVGDHLLRGTTFAKPSALYAAIFVGGAELVGSGYARAACAPGDSNWSAPSAGNGQFANAVPITWPAPSAAWGTMSDVVLYDAATAGNEWCRCTGMTYAMDPGAPTTLPVGALVATIG